SGRDAADVAARLGIDRRATELLLNALVAMHLVRKDRDRFKETEVSRAFLRNDSPTSYAAMVRFDAAQWPLWERLEETVRSGTPPRTTEMFQSDPEETACFIDGMASLVRARGDARVLAETLDLSGASRLLDV